MFISVVIPTYNRLPILRQCLMALERQELAPPIERFEVVLVDDGSTDDSRARMQQWKKDHNASWLRIVALEKNCGQSGAVMAGVEVACAPIITTLDGDMQNDPRDLPDMVQMVESGQADAVVGVRRKRQDTWTRRMSSRIGNGVRNWVTGDKVTDAACGIKTIRREFFLRAHAAGLIPEPVELEFVDG